MHKKPTSFLWLSLGMDVFPLVLDRPFFHESGYRTFPRTSMDITPSSGFCRYRPSVKRKPTTDIPKIEDRLKVFCRWKTTHNSSVNRRLSIGHLFIKNLLQVSFEWETNRFFYEWRTFRRLPENV